MKQKVNEAKRAADFRWGQGFGSDFEKDKKKVLERSEESEERELKE